MIARLLGALTTIEGRNTIGCLVVVPILISCLHYHHYRLRRDKADWPTVSEIADPIISEQMVTAEGQEYAETSAAANMSCNFGLGHIHGLDDSFGFLRYNETDDEDDALEEVEITLDLGRMEGNLMKFFSRMNRIMM